MTVHSLENAPPPRGPLASVGIIVTRPARQAAGLARQLAALDATPIIIPAIVILPPANRTVLDRVHATLGDFDIAIFVSANAVEYGVPAPDTWPADLQIFAPGPGTAAALVATGIEDVRIPTTTFDSEGLLSLPELRDVAMECVAALDHLHRTLDHELTRNQSPGLQRFDAPSSAPARRHNGS